MAVCLLFLAYFLTRLSSLERLPVFLDESVHIQWSERLYGEGRILRPVGAGRLLGVAAYGLALPFDDRVPMARTVATLAGAVSLFFTVLLARRLFGDRAAVIAGVLYCLSPFALTYDRLALSDGFLSASLTALMYATRRLLVDDFKPSVRVMTVTLILLAVLSKVSALLFMGFIPFGVLCLAKDRAAALRRMAGPTTLGLALAAPMLWFFYANSGEIGAQHVVDPLSGGTIALATLRDMSDWLLSYFTIPLLLGAAVSLVLLRNGPAVWLLTSMIVPFFLFALLSQPWSARYILPTLTPVLILVAGGIETVASRFGGVRGTAFAGILTLVASISAAPFSARLLTVPETAPFPPDDRAQLVTGWPSGYGIRELARRLDRESKDGPLLVYVDTGGTRTLPTSLSVLLRSNPRIRLIEMDLHDPRARGAIVDGLSHGLRSLAALGPRAQDADFRTLMKGSQVERLEVFQRPGGEWAATLFEILSAHSP